ncbi:MAG: DUF2283 domain-containing protein [Microgenomates group bacterium]|jgi:uncharacterized protein YuzE
MKKFYDPETDSLMIVFKEGAEDSYEEIAPGINMEFDKEGEVIGIEVLNVSLYDKQESSESKSNFKISPVLLKNSAPMNSVSTRFYTISA